MVRWDVEGAEQVYRQVWRGRNGLGRLNETDSRPFNINFSETLARRQSIAKNGLTHQQDIRFVEISLEDLLVPFCETEVRMVFEGTRRVSI
jgi:hypothetical protein